MTFIATLEEVEYRNENSNLIGRKSIISQRKGTFAKVTYGIVGFYWFSQWVEDKRDYYKEFKSLKAAKKYFDSLAPDQNIKRFTQCME